MSDNQDLKSKILLMRQKNFSEVVNQTNEKNDNEKPENAEHDHNVTNTETDLNKDKDIQNKVQGNIQNEISPDIFELKENLNKRVVIFWTGDNVISERINNSSLKSIQNFFKNPLAIWDNFYANDYCPSRLFLGPLKGRSLNNSIVGHFLNGTGLKETDKFLLNYLYNPKQKVPYLPKELKPIFSDPFKKLNEKELQRALNISKKSIRFIFENPLDEILLEWKPFLMSSLNDIKLFHLESKKEVEGFLERRYSPLFVKGLTKKR